MSPQQVEIGMWVGTFAAFVAAILTAFICRYAWWQPPLSPSVRRLADVLTYYREIKELSGAAVAANCAPLTGDLDRGAEELAAAIEKALQEVGLQPLSLPYPSQVRLASEVAEWAAGLRAERAAARLAGHAPDESRFLSREEQVAASPIQRVIESELRNPDTPKWRCEECGWHGDDLERLLTASDGEVDACPDCGEPDALAVTAEYFEWVNAQFANSPGAGGGET